MPAASGEEAAACSSAVAITSELEYIVPVGVVEHGFCACIRTDGARSASTDATIAIRRDLARSIPRGDNEVGAETKRPGRVTDGGAVAQQSMGDIRKPHFGGRSHTVVRRLGSLFFFGLPGWDADSNDLSAEEADRVLGSAQCVREP
jgi:hypothetical protein